MINFGKDLQDFIRDCQVVVIAGGLGQGLKHRTGDDLPKPLLKIKDKTLMDYCIELFSNAGYKHFVLLLGNLAEKIQSYVGDGSKYGVNVGYSVEKEKLGKGGAIKLALENGSIERGKPCVIAYPDDLITDPNFPKDIVKGHLKGMKLGALATIICVSSTMYRWGVPKLDERGFVVEFVEKPPVYMPATIGRYVLQPEVYAIIEETIGEKKPADFENLVLPEFVKRKVLFNHMIPPGSWIPVNDEKEFMTAVEFMSKAS